LNILLIIFDVEIYVPGPGRGQKNCPYASKIHVIDEFF